MPTKIEIKKRLAECYKKRQPVLLHSDNHKNVFDRVRLVQKVHTENGGVLESPVEFIKTKKEPTREIFINKIGEQLNKALHDEYYKEKTKEERIASQKAQLAAHGFDISEESSNDILSDTAALAEMDLFRIEAESILRCWQFQISENQIPPENQFLVEIKNKVQEHFKSTDKTYLEIDCEYDKGKEVYSFLVQKNVLYDIKIPLNPFLKEQFFLIPISESILFDFQGTVFLNNLHCDPCSEEDKKYYSSLGNIIEKHKMEPEDNLLQEVNPINSKAQYDVSVNWIVAYTHDPNDFPEPLRKRFIDQFEPIPLDGKGAGVESVKERIKTEDRQQEGKRKDNFDDVKLKITIADMFCERL